jgi:hypothetical protein
VLGDGTVGATGVGQGTGDPAKALVRGKTGTRGPEHHAELLGHRSHERGAHGGDEPDVVPAGHLRGLCGIGGAANEPEQGEVVHLGQLVSGDPGPAGKLQRQQAGAERMLHRLPGPKVGRQRQGRHQLREPQRPRGLQPAAVHHVPPLPVGGQHAPAGGIRQAGQRPRCGWSQDQETISSKVAPHGQKRSPCCSTNAS